MTEDITPRMRWMRIAARDGRGARATRKTSAAEHVPGHIRQSIAL